MDGTVAIICESSKCFHRRIAVSLDLARADSVVKISAFNVIGTEQQSKPVRKCIIII